MNAIRLDFDGWKFFLRHNSEGTTMCEGENSSDHCATM